MLLTNHEREFLATFIHEATTDPFKGPATEELHRRDIYYTDLRHLLAAYYHESPPDQESFGGRTIIKLPPCPWADRDTEVFQVLSCLPALQRRGTRWFWA